MNVLKSNNLSFDQIRRIKILLGEKIEIDEVTQELTFL